MSAAGTLLSAEAGEVRCSRWFTVDQPRIDAFAAVTEDSQGIHVDPEAARTTQFGGTIAHGFLTLSLLSAMASDALPAPEGTAISLNYGFDRVRFVTPVRCGASVRGRFVLEEVSERRPCELTLFWDAVVEIEDVETPALVARWITRRILKTLTG